MKYNYDLTHTKKDILGVVTTRFLYPKPVMQIISQHKIHFLLCSLPGDYSLKASEIESFIKTHEPR